MTDAPAEACPVTAAMAELTAEVGGAWTQEKVDARRAELAAIRDLALQSPPPAGPEGD